MVFFSFCVIICLAQDPYAIIIDKAKGLPSNEVYYILQDTKGFIWFATGEGLCRYDGFEFKTYSNILQTSKSGSEIHEDKYGRIWYENFDGYLYYVENDSLKYFRQNIPIGYLPFGIVEDKLFLMQKKGVDIYDLHSLKLFKTILLDFSTLSNTQQTKTHFYVMRKSLTEIDVNGNVSEIPLNPVPQKGTYSILQKSGNSLFFVLNRNHKRVCCTVLNKNIISKFPLDNTEFIQAASYTDHAYWFCSPKGVYGFEENGASVNGGRPFFSDKSISCVLKDREGNFWFSTTNDGVLFVPDIHSFNVKTPYQPSRITLNKNSIYIGTKNDELYHFNLRSFQSDIIYKGNSNAEVYFLKWDSGENKIYYTANEFKMLNEAGKELFSWGAAIKDIKRINEKYYAVAISGAAGLLSLQNKPENEWDSIVEKNRNPNRRNIIGDMVSGVRAKSTEYDTKNNIIYYAANNGLFAATPNSVNEIKHNNKSIYISKLLHYENKIFGLNTQGQLFEIKGKNTITLSTINTDIGFQPIKKVNIQNQFLFLFTEKQLLFYDFIKNKLDTVMLNFRFSEISDLVVWQNKLVLANKSGILFSDFLGQKNQLIKPLFVINSIEVNNRLQKFDALHELKYFQNNITINYAVLSFKTGSDFPLYYKINSNEWELISSKTRSLKLISLAPGNYTIAFRLGEKSGGIQIIKFNILKPFWLRTWFLTLLFLFAVITLYAYFKRQVNNLKKRNQLLSEKIELELGLNSSILTSIKSQMNPHFFYNALNTIQSFIFTNDNKNATSFLSKFSKLTRIILEMSEKENITIAEELTALNLYLEIEKVRFGNDFEFLLIVEENIDKDYIQIPPMLIQPCVENAVKHGLLHKKGQKELKVIFTIEQDTLKVIIDDNGIGRKHSEELNNKVQSGFRSFSTSANQKRLEILNRYKKNQTVMHIIDKTDDKNIAIVTKVIITIPIY